MNRWPRSVAFLSLVFLLALFTGLGRRGAVRGLQLKSEILLKLYDEAISHYEKARALYEAGDPEGALQELRRATKVYSRFPEAYALGQSIYTELGKPKEARDQASFLRHSQAAVGASLYQERERLAQEIERRRREAKPPDIQLVPALLISAVFAAVFFLGMIWEYRRLTGSKEEIKKSPIFLEEFPEEGVKEVVPSWLFKLCALLFPVPILFALLVLFGFRTYENLWPVFIFTGVIVDGAVYLIFFADLRDLGGFRRPGGAA